MGKPPKKSGEENNTGAGGGQPELSEFCTFGRLRTGSFRGADGQRRTFRGIQIPPGAN